MMIRKTTTLALAFFATALAGATSAEAQYTVTSPQACPPGQPCVVVVPQDQTQAQPVQPVQGQVVQGYAPVQQRQAVEVRRTRMRWGMIGAGIGLTVGGWIANWLTAIPAQFAITGESRRDQYVGWSYLPWIGPFVDAGYMSDETDNGLFALHLLYGIMQSAGLLLCILGTVLAEEEVVVQYVFGEDGPALSVLPWANEHGAGASVSLVGF